MKFTHKVIRRGGAIVRDGPGLEFSAAKTLPAGTLLSVVKLRNEWAIVDLRGDGYTDGYVAADDIDAVDVGNARLPDAGGRRGAFEATAIDDGGELEDKPIVSQKAAVDSERLDVPRVAPRAESAAPFARLDTSHKPVPGWEISETSGASRQFWLTYQGLSSPLKLGYAFTYADENPDTRGLARTSTHQPVLAFEPQDWRNDFGLWPELIYPTSWAESNANFLVVNAWDVAAITFGFIQLAAHTADDLIPFFKRLIRNLPEETRQWFPELALVDGALCYRKDGQIKMLENARRPTDGARSASYYRGDFMEFFNPNRRMVDKEELHAAARWIEWTRRSVAMRREQVASSIENMKSSLAILHRELKRSGSSRYPEGVDGMRCDHLAAAIAVPHLSEAKVGKAVSALHAPDVLEAFRTLEYGPGERESNVVKGVRARGTRLSSLRYSLGAGAPMDQIAVVSPVPGRGAFASEKAAGLFSRAEGHVHPDSALKEGVGGPFLADLNYDRSQFLRSPVSDEDLVSPDLHEDDPEFRDDFADAVAGASWAPDAESFDYSHLKWTGPIGQKFRLRAADLALLAELNDFPAGRIAGTPILFGLRGCRIVESTEHFETEVVLVDDRPTHVKPKCVMGVWDRDGGRIAAFAGSTVPQANVASRATSGNMLATGYYGYLAGAHCAGSPVVCRPGCFLLRSKPQVKRTVIVRRRGPRGNQFNLKDLIDMCEPGDNIHPTFRNHMESFSSIGCLAVQGFADSGGNHTGAWKKFRKSAGMMDDDGDPGKNYDYMLLTGLEALMASQMREASLQNDPAARRRLRRLRFGSESGAVATLQSSLGLANHGKLDPETAEAFYKRQSARQGGACDGIYTPDFDDANGGIVFGRVA